ncbi:MAG: hypothetical protein ACE5FL_14610 [Myxococcota bacterium]
MLEVGHRGGWLVAVAGVVLVALAGSARAESSLRLPLPEHFGTISASTYDENQRRVGDAHVVFEDLGDSRVRLLLASGIDGGARTVATAEFAVVDGGEHLQLLTEESRSFDPDGLPLGVLRIDHERGVGSCNTPRDGGMKRVNVDLPEEDRVANIPLNLLFQPLVEGTTDEVNFQLLLCRFGARLVDIDAVVASREAEDPVVEVEYRPDFGVLVSAVAKKWLPRLSMWFDRSGSNHWIAHRVPLYSKGPNVFVIRDGVPRSWLGLGN